MAAEAPAFWRRRGPLAWLLSPLSLLFASVAGTRRWLYASGARRAVRLSVPVIVVGNIAAGGSGKTPVVDWLVRQLLAAGWQPGVVSRGYGGSVKGVAIVPADGDPAVFGDEPVLLARLVGRPLAVGRDRPAAARALLARHPECDIIVTDDGMQHYRLARDVEVAVVDEALLGNRLLLPAGPLREPVGRLIEADLVIAHGELSPGLRARLASTPVFAMRLEGTQFRSLREPAETRDAAAFRGLRVHAVAGIGRPQRFFDQLAAMGLEVEPHAFPDHHRFGAADLNFGDAKPIMMTSKDAVKCRAFAPDNCWELPVRAQIGSGAAERILETLKNGRETA